MKKLKKNLFILKVKIFFLFLLPAFIVLLSLRTLETFLRIRLRRSACSLSHSTEHAPVIRPVSQTSFRPDFITPVPVLTESINEPSQT